MSGAGKSTVLVELARRGYRVVDTDDPGWKIGELWDEEKVARLLVQNGPTLFVSGTVENQGRFYDRFDAVVLLSAATDVLLDRVASRTTNDWGKAPEERELILAHVRDVEPLLRTTCTHEIDTRAPLADVVGRLVAIAEG
jgi:hypothetical protein